MRQIRLAAERLDMYYDIVKEAFFVSSYSSTNIMNGAFPSKIETKQQHHLLEDREITMSSDTTLVFIFLLTGPAHFSEPKKQTESVIVFGLYSWEYRGAPRGSIT